MDANELGRWTRFAAKGGIGKCSAVQDCVAEEAEDLMFMKDDEIVVLMQLPAQDDIYLGYCEGVVGRFHGTDVRFHGRLKKPVMTKRSSRSLSRSSSRPSSSQGSAPPLGRESLSALARRDSPSLSTAPSRMSYSYSAASISVTEDLSTSTSTSTVSSPLHHYSSPPLPSSPHLPAPPSSNDESQHIRSASHSSGSTALDSAPRTPADFNKEDSDDLIHVVSLSRQVASPTDLHRDSSIRQESSGAMESLVITAKRLSLTETAPLRITRKDTVMQEDIRPLEHDEEPASFLDSEPSTRISVAMSDGEVGIGLSLLQDFMGGDIDDTVSVRSSKSGMRTPELRNPAILETTASPASTLEGNAASIRSLAISDRSSIYSTASHQSTYSQIPEDAPRQRSNPTSPRDAPSRASMHPSISDSDYNGEEWEGASDIYDNYRYSRYSMASKASRFSKGSMHTVASAFGLEAPPPVPVDSNRPSLDSLRQGSFSRERLGSLAATSASVEDVRGRRSFDSSGSFSSPKDGSDAKGCGSEGKRIPPPLDISPSHRHKQQSVATISPESTTSPLLHGTFNSPLTSPTQHSASYLSPLSPPLTTPFYSNAPGGAASALRHRLEQNGTSLTDTTVDEASSIDSQVGERSRISSQPIVVDDADEPARSPPGLTPTSPSAMSSSPPPSPSYISEKKRMLETTYIVANQAPPPPYTPMSPTAGSSSQALPEEVQAQPQQQPTQPFSEPMVQPTPRPINPERQNNSFARRSMFMPHPHAPKPAETPSGPMYGRQAPHQAPQGYQTGPPPGSAIYTLHMALVMRGDPMRPRQMTIYGRFELDLSSSIGPVPVFFTLEPPNNIPANRFRPPTAPSSPAPSEQPGESADYFMMNSSVTPPPENGAGKAIPRANFFPKVKTPRPRSRSFSGFDSSAAEVIIPTDSSANESGQPIQIPSLNAMAKRSKSAHVSSPSPASPPPASSSSPATSGVAYAVRTAHKPSPLSLSQNNVVATRSPTSAPPMSPTRPPPSPLSYSMARSPPRSPTPGSPTTSESKISLHMSLGQASSAIGSPVITSPPLPSSDLPTARPVLRKISSSSIGNPATASSQASPTNHRPSRILRHSRSSTLSNRPSARDPSPHSRTSMQGRRSGETDASHQSEAHSGVASPLLQTSSLRSKLSLPSLKIRGSERPVQYEERSPTLSLTPSEHSDQPMVNVKDMNFELVKPVGQLASIIEDPLMPPPLPSPNRLDGGSLRADSPAFSMLSGMSARTGLTQSSVIETPRVSVAGTTGTASLLPLSKNVDTQTVEAHRQRELRWISMISSIPASQARKNKKVRKLLWEGVPASVRYLVWAHLTDSKAKRMDGLYGKLVKRDRVPASASIERDVQRVFVHEPQLLDGSLVNLLQAYLSMVPDVSYSRGLTVIAGDLLLHSPEEDAFWTFVSLMDSHLRPYFSAHGVQMEVDASLFGKAVEAADPNLAKKVFVDMAIPPASLCRPWFTALFMEALPSEHAQRVWDIFLFEGVVFLIRVGLAIVSCCKQTVMTTAGRDAVLNTLLHPPSACLPTNADTFLEMALNVKLKDDDVRKQRTKLEAQVKQQTQARNQNQTAIASGGAPPSISLPR